jgi:hypothetical protein
MAELSQPNTLLKKPSVTIYFDGLLVFCYDKRQKRLQVGIHTEAHFHALSIKVRERGQSTNLQSLILEHERIKEIAPLFLYVENKRSSMASSGAATLYKPDDPSYSQAFANVIDLQSKSFHKHDHLKVKPNILAPLNILNGEFYSAIIGEATRKNLDCDPNPFNLGLVATRAAADISNTSGNLILRSNDHKADPIIKLALSDEKHYEVSIFNEPTLAPMPDADHTHHQSGCCAPQNGESRINHFNVYYEAFVLKDDATKYMVEIKEDPGSTTQDSGPALSVVPEDPPCIIVQVGDITELP